MNANPRLIVAAGLAPLIVIAAGTAIALRAASTSPTPVSAPARSGRFLTAAEMPQGLGGRAAPRFELADARGGSFSSARLSGHPFLLTFLHTHCVDVCPLIGSEIHDALADLGPRASDMTVVAISVDPRGDTVPAVKRWLVAHHEPANFHYLVGSTRQLAPVWKAFYVSLQTPGDPHSSHTAVIWLINRRAHLAALVPAGVPIDTHNLAHDLDELIRET